MNIIEDETEVTRDIDIRTLSEALKGSPKLQNITLEVKDATALNFTSLLVDHKFVSLDYVELFITEKTRLTDLIILTKVRSIESFMVEIDMLFDANGD